MKDLAFSAEGGQRLERGKVWHSKEALCSNNIRPWYRLLIELLSSMFLSPSLPITLFLKIEDGERQLHQR